jgi:RNA polymerase sigma-70 factor (ECF subfamily)
VGVDLGTVRDQRAYLVRIATRQSLDRLRTLGRRKESYVGPWLPEPLLTAPDVTEDVELADSVSMAMPVLETLTPIERAVFVLHEVFDLEYDEIAEPSTRARPRSANSHTGHEHTSQHADHAGSLPRYPAYECVAVGVLCISSRFEARSSLIEAVDISMSRRR